MVPESPEEVPTPFLDEIGRDLTAAAAAGDLDPVIGREAEIQEALAILTKSRKNNVILVGDPGVGKTAIAEGLAHRVVEGRFPPSLEGVRIVALELSALTAGAGVRGVFEERVRGLLQEIEAAGGSIILFVDEIHTLLGAGQAEGGLDGANLFKPALARGAFRCIGATTTREFREIFERDQALTRRFQPIVVEEPSRDETEEILLGLLPELERAHRVAIPRPLIGRAIEWADRYVPDRRRPDKVIDLLDESSADLRLFPEPADGSAAAEVSLLRSLLQAADDSGDSEEAGRLRRILHLYRRLHESRERGILDEEALSRTIRRWKGVDPVRLGEREVVRLERLEGRLRRHLIGQDEALATVATRLRQGRLTAQKRPAASFLFLGPTGVGKTETAFAIAEEHFGDPRAIVRIDLSEHKEEHSVARLVGSPPGYVGYREIGALARQVLDRPASVVLFDEIEKGHPATLDLLLQILDDGHLRDGAGRDLDFRSSVVVLTSNLASREGAAVGFGSDSDEGGERDTRLRRSLGRVLRPELVNRIDEIVEYRPLSREALLEIVRRDLRRAVMDLRREHGLRVRTEAGLAETILDRCGGIESGARAIRREIERLVGRATIGDSKNGELRIASH